MQKLRKKEKEELTKKIHPSYYRGGKYEPIDVIQDWKLNFCLGNVVKYVARAGKKTGNSAVQDLQKAKRYLEYELEEIQKCQKL